MEAGVHLRHSDETEASTENTKNSAARTAVTEPLATKSIGPQIVASPGRACKQFWIAKYSVIVRQAREQFWILCSFELISSPKASEAILNCVNESRLLSLGSTADC